MKYDKHHFDPPAAKPSNTGETYEVDREGLIVLAVNVALSTGRPLLVRGPTGCGKSSLARFVARVKDWRLQEATITSRTEARDLMWTFDAVRRLSDAQAAPERVADLRHYVRPGVLWRAFDPADASALDALQEREPMAEGDSPVVVLIDEIDKADPELPNDLLVPVESGAFPVDDLPGHVVRRRDPSRAILLVITTNETRALPAAFLRRCVVLDIDPPDGIRLAAIGALHFRDVAPALLNDLTDRVIACAESMQRRPSIAEYLDAVRACHDLGVRPGDPSWDAVLELTVLKRNASGSSE